MSSHSSDLPGSADHPLEGEAQPGLRMIPMMMMLRPDANRDMGSGINIEDILDMWTLDKYQDTMGDLKAKLGSTLKIFKGPIDMGSGEVQVGRLSEMAKLLEGAFKGLDNVESIEQAIQCRSIALDLTPMEHPERARRVDMLGHSFHSRYERLDGLADVDEAVDCHIQAVLLTPDDDINKPSRITHLGTSLCSRFERLGRLADLDMAMKCYTEALRLTPNDDEYKPSRLSGLGVSYMRRFEHLGELTDVDMSIEYQSQALLLTPDDDEVKSDWLGNLGTTYRLRFERLGELMDIDKAVECHTQSLLLTRVGHPETAGRLQNLGASCISRFVHLGKRVDADKAIEYQTQSVLLTPDNHSDQPYQLNNLGASYMRRFEHFEDLADVDKGIEYLTKSVQLTPDDHAGKPARLSNLGTCYMLRFELVGELTDIDKAIESQSQAVLLVPDGHAHKPGLLLNLGQSYRRRFKQLGNIADLERARSSFQQAAEQDGTDPSIKISCARRWAKACKSLDLSPLSAYERCMALIPHVVWLGTTIDQRYIMIATISDLVTEAAAWAISAQEFDLAIEWLEQGRSIVWNQVLQLRTPLDDLAVVDAALAQCLNDVACQLGSAGTRQSEDTSSDLEKDAQCHRRLADEWDRLLEQARNIPGFEHFMRPRTADQLKLAATDGPVVVINTHATRCDALIILPQCDNITHIPLETLSLEKLSGIRVRLDSLLVHRGDRAGGFKRLNPPATHQDTFKAILATLWADVVKPVFDCLTSMGQIGIGELPHITWCTTGVLAFLPLHAAGCYDGSHRNAFDLLISSYTPTLSALLAPSISPSNPDLGLLLVGQEHTEGLSSLPSTVRELAVIQEHTQARHLQKLDCENATVDAVLSAMDEYSWVHLACHATQDSVNPAHSAFHLHDGNLTLETITKRQFKNKGLAFLSACQTAKGDGKLPDEAVHLAAGMLMAGYPSVIATMWSIADVDGPEVAGRVYAELVKDERMDHKGAAMALHTAVAELREKIGEDSFERWVPFIHIGV